MKKIKAHPYLLIMSILTMALGVALLFVNPNDVMMVIYYIVGSVLIITGISKLYIGSRFAGNSYITITDGAIDIIGGIVLIFWHNIVVTIILAVLFLIMPIVRICMASNRKNAFLKELPLLILGVIIAFSGDALANVFVKASGVVFILVAIYLIVTIFTTKIVTWDEPIKKTPKKDSIEATYEERESNE